MTYLFDVDDAARYGLEEAVMLYNFRFWISKNKANGTHLRDGRTWTYNSVAAFEKLFPFWSAAQVRRVLASLIEQGVLITGNYNDNQYLRTLWYAFKDESKFLLNTISPNAQMETLESGNAIVQTGKTSTNTKPKYKTQLEDQVWSMPFANWKELQSAEARAVLYAWVKRRREKDPRYSDRQLYDHLDMLRGHPDPVESIVNTGRAGYVSPVSVYQKPKKKDTDFVNENSFFTPPKAGS